MQSWAARAQQHQLQHGSPEEALSGAPYSRRNPLAKELFHKRPFGRAISTVMLVQMGVFSEGNKPRPP
ncbi:BZ3500_MvSof-1268-A1-R1_Chr6-3g08683 [Microbotryum saponariae]|uniref:BZ3500_MvSof-1268-A1-R1_Chr6-3g08683 protein n=1 Tax=Microbotryum saponariae TaxID=289078 RepID=A0A2X0L409_9BASI|nr:BZ3500_MvSof-1268-A1-R1_Chr6-3g08683 [Microbotryum saponariae]SDA07284.1 BZ3501_MvSof-1269-A2-R1_Chr6-2g08386 [Microbotryum saponariae]